MHKLHQILVPVDFSPSSRAAIEHAAFLGQHYGAAVDVLHVWHPPRWVGADADLPAAFAATEAGRELMEYRAMLKRRGVARVLLRVERGDPVETILAIAGEEPVDLVVMGTHGHTGLLHVIMGSVAERVVRYCGKPVLTIRPSEETLVTPVAVGVGV